MQIMSLLYMGIHLHIIRLIFANIHHQMLSINCELQRVFILAKFKLNKFGMRISKCDILVENDLYLEIYANTMNFNRFFIIPLGLTLSTYCTMNVTCSYLFVSTIRRALLTSKCNDIAMIVWLGILILGCYGNICNIIYIFSNVKNEAQKTVTYIHDIWNTLASRNEIDKETRHLQLISLQLYNSKHSFTAYGFFALDWTLLQRIIAAVTTYVVILIQFEMSSNTKNSFTNATLYQ
uniref:Gustatory receptor 15 n=1 Tax=Holotrichia parallela TaxID=93412 RepID=A0A2P9JYC1_HOLPA|nr:gustatory receptor 15 [Holotrichia parallela]